MSAAFLKPLPKNRFGYWQAYHLLNRAGFGALPHEVKRVAELGLDDAVAHLVRFQDAESQPVASDKFQSDLMPPFTEEEQRAYARARRSGDQKTVEALNAKRQQKQRADRRQVREMQKWWIERMATSPRPLEEKMTLFFHGHFATSYRSIDNSYHLFMQNQLFRAHATGNFRTLTGRIIRDPAMLAYLDNNDSRKERPNENLSRELMELFTLGEGNGYSERDIREGSRALTGYSFSGNQFVFRPAWHDNGIKRLFGRAGRHDGDDFVQLIFTRPQCSQYLCLKLYKFFVNDLPNGTDSKAQRIILELAGRMRAAKYELAPVLETLFKSEHFYAPENTLTQIKSPVQLAIGAARSLGAPVRDSSVLADALGLMGQNLFLPPSVKGWDGGRSWINTSTLYVRQNLLTHQLTGRMPAGYARRRAGPRGFDPQQLVESMKRADGSYDVGQTTDFLLHHCLGAEPHEARRKTVAEFTKNESGGRITNDFVTRLLCLITAMPDYQLC
jgi:uncharacterized protein (DUF1800 family)